MRIGLAAIAIAAGGFFAARDFASADPPPDPVTVTVVSTVSERYQGWTARTWAAHAALARRDANLGKLRLRRANQRIRAQRSEARRRWSPTVTYAIRLASAVYGVPEGKMRAVAYCESTFNPMATNGRYRGLFQLGWEPFGMSPFDPVASALSTAQTVVRDGGWRQWSCG